MDRQLAWCQCRARRVRGCERSAAEIRWKLLNGGKKNTGQDRKFQFIIKLFSNKNKMAHMLGKVQCLGLLVNHQN